ncbi:MAG: Lrp/AsnC family transcriptional regulator [archaeon]|nr:Lrp/AsnC family transcriptional regulator [archaeon]
MRKFILSHRSIVWAGVLDGTWDLSITVAARSAKEFDTILKEFTSRFNDHIFHKTVLLVVEASDFIIGYNKETKMVDLGIDDDIVDIDDMDYRILSAISVNARVPYVYLAKAADTIIDVVRYRLKKLNELGVIKGFRVWLESSLTGKNLYEILFSMQNVSHQREKNLLGYCRRSANVTYALKV